MKPALDAIRNCLEGAVPGVMATCAPDGTPNVAYLSQVEYVDRDHVALSFQFFNKTRENILANPRGRLLVADPLTAAMYRLSLYYLRTETEGPLFERMKAKLAGIASHTGMGGVFRLRGSDVYRVLDIEAVPGSPLSAPPARASLLAAVRRASERLGGCADLDRLLNEVLDCLQSLFDIRYAMVLLLDESGQRLYTVASRGYEASGVGSEIARGDGVIGVAAREGAPIRIGHMTSEYSYGRAVRTSALEGGLGGLVQTEIPFPGLAESRSQLAVPIRACGQLLGVLFAESRQDMRFGYDDEDALVSLASLLGASITHLQHAGEQIPESPPGGALPSPAPGGRPLMVKYYGENDSVFLDDDYLIKGVAGAIFWTIARDHVKHGRTEFTNRELRLDPRVRLPDVADNLEARLILLQRRLADRGGDVCIERTGRGRFRLRVRRPLELVEVSRGA